MTYGYKKFTIEMVRALVDEKSDESIDLEFKREYTLATDGQKKDFCYDITALANTVGGTILVGVDEVDKRASEVVGVDSGLFETLKAKMRDVLQSNVHPSVVGVRYDKITDGIEPTVLAIYVPRSFNGPHFVHTGDSGFRVYARNMTHIYPMGHPEIRQRIVEQVDFDGKRRAKRNNRVVDLQSVCGLLADSTPTFILQCLSEDVGLTSIEFSPAELLAHVNHARFQRIGLTEARCNFDGVVMESESDYLQAYRDGSITLVFVGGIDPPRSGHDLGARKIVGRILSRVDALLEAANGLKAAYPRLLTLELRNATNVTLIADSIGKCFVNRASIVLPEVPLLDRPTSSQDAVWIWFDRIWQACGHVNGCDKKYGV